MSTTGLVVLMALGVLGLCVVWGLAGFWLGHRAAMEKCLGILERRQDELDAEIVKGMNL